MSEKMRELFEAKFSRDHRILFSEVKNQYYASGDSPDRIYREAEVLNGRWQGYQAAHQSKISNTDGWEVSGWIEFSGGECPVQPGTYVEVKQRFGNTTTATLAESIGWEWYKEPENKDLDIVAYRIVGYTEAAWLDMLVAALKHPPQDGPEFGDGHDWEGFPGGCKRLGCTSNCSPPKEQESVPGQEQSGTTQEVVEYALNTRHPDCHKAADAFWQYWKENGATHRRGYYEATWGAINQAIRYIGVKPHDYLLPKIEVAGTTRLSETDDLIPTPANAEAELEALMMKAMEQAMHYGASDKFQVAHRGDDMAALRAIVRWVLDDKGNSMDRCPKCQTRLSWIAGEPAHPDNQYCDNCGWPHERVGAEVEKAVISALSDTIQVSRAEYEALRRDADRLDHLDRHASVNFDYENCILNFEVPDDFQGCNSIREAIDAAINMPTNGEEADEGTIK